MSEQSVYKPSRPGARAIPLSFTGRHLLQSLREAITDAIADGDFNARGGAVSNVREKIAQRMSDLERKVERFFLGEVSDTQLLDECEKRGIGRIKLAPGVYDARPRVVNVVDPVFKFTAPPTYEVTVDTTFGKTRLQVEAVSYDDAATQARQQYPGIPSKFLSIRKL